MSQSIIETTIFDVVKDFSGTNPSGVWSYGKGTVGGQFEAYPNFKTDKVDWWMGSEPWHSVYKNNSSVAVQLSGGLLVQPGILVQHPGDKSDHLTIVRFTAPQDGTYGVSAKWTTIDEQAKKTWTWVVTNAASVTGKTYDFTPPGFKEIHTVGITGYRQSVAFTRDIAMKKGEILSFEVGNGGDGYLDDSVQLELKITKQ